MNIFHKYTQKSLAKNRTRTLVTVIGIVLSMALFTAVIEGAYSGLQFMIRSEIARSGAYHGYFPGLTEEQAQEVSAAVGIRSTACWREVGWAEIGSENPDKPYLRIQAIDAQFTDFASVQMLSGRLPEAPGEILLPAHLSVNGEVNIREGETITLPVGRRAAADGTALDADTAYLEGDETLTDMQERTYTVVGIYERPDYTLERFSCPGYTALTVGEADGPVGVLFTVTNPGRYYSILQQSGLGYKYEDHADLLRLYGSVGNNYIARFLYTFAAILVALISFGSISLIYNSFSISVSERTKQFGMLKSVGATKKQIRSSVLYEALLLGAVGIPLGAVVGCAGIGIALWALRDAFSLLWRGDARVKMYLVLNPGAMLAATAVCLVTLLISAWIPARRAMRLSPIDAIRQSEDVKIRRRDVRTGRWVRRLFGFEGMMARKNFGRNRKRYRVTVVSLFMSVVLFISACSFCHYLMSAVEGVGSSDNGADIEFYFAMDELNDADPDELLVALKEAEDVTRGAYHTSDGVLEIRYSLDDLTRNPFLDERIAYAKEQGLHEVSDGGGVIFLDDDSFRALCRENGLDPAPFYQKDAPVGLFFNRQTIYERSGDGSYAWRSYALLDEQRLPVTATMIHILNVDGYVLINNGANEDGAAEYLYMPEDYMISYWQSDEEGKELDMSLALRLSAEEAEERADITAAAIVEKLTFPVAFGQVCFIYPACMRDAVLPEAFRTGTRHITYCFQSRSHTASFEAIKGILTARGLQTSRLQDRAQQKESQRMLVLIIQVFSYGFIILISLIALANVFNTISTSIMLRRREFAMLKSIGLGEKGFRRMMNYECMIYGAKGLLFGLPVSFGVSYLLYRATADMYEMPFTLPWYAVAIAVGSVFLVVFATMLYATAKIRRDNPIDALKTENL